jgi:molybdopterin biosynthesis enzyme
VARALVPRTMLHQLSRRKERSRFTASRCVPRARRDWGKSVPSLVLLLPGNPVSCLCAYDFFAGRAIRRLGGRSAEWPYPIRTLPVGRKIVSAVGRVDYCRVRIVEDRVEPLALSGASILSSTTRADGFVVISRVRRVRARTLVDVYF